MSRICVFFGHRDCPADLSEQLDNVIRRAVTEENIDTFWCGGMGDFDHQAAEAVRRMKKEFPHLRLELALAYLPPAPDERHQRYDATFFPDGLETVPKRYAISRRNAWLARHCDLVICYTAFSWGGAYQAVQQAQRKHKTIWNLAEQK